MKKSCAYCGRIHEKNYICPKKPVRKHTYNDRDEESAAFRRTNAWKKKAVEIKERDHYCCVICRSGLYPIGTKEINYKNLEVHRIVKLSQDIDKGLEDDNLITLCAVHHRMADKSEIPERVLKELIGADGND